MLRFRLEVGFKVYKPNASMRNNHLISRKKHRWGVLAHKNVECKHACFLSGLHIHVCMGVLKQAKFLLLSLVQSNFMCCPCSLLKRFIMTSNLPRRSRHLQNLAPEEDSLGTCFICQDKFRIEQLSHLQKTDCCRVLLHRHC